MTYGAFLKLRAALESDVADDYADDPKRRAKIGSPQYDKDVRDRQKAGGVALDSDVPKQDPAALLRSGAVAGLGILHGVTAAFASGRELGHAAGALAHGLEHAFTGAASGFVHAGEGVLALALSPFGQSGQIAAKMVGGLGNGLVAALSGAGGVAAAGLKIGVGLAAGIVGGIGVALGAAGGTLIGGLVGALVSGGAGVIPGAIAGAGIGAAVAGAVVQAFAGIVSIVSSGIGQALESIGSAFGKLGETIGSFLSGVKGVLDDLISTGAKMSQASLSTQRSSGMTAFASSQATAFSQIMTGRPDALNGMFNNVGLMAMYAPSRNRAFGIEGAGQNFVENLPGMFQKWQSFGDSGMGPLQRREMLRVEAPGAEDTIGGMFSLGPAMIQKVMEAVKRTTLSPQENLQNAGLAIDLNVIQADLDRMKTKLLSDLMPAINLVLGTFSKWFTQNESKIIGGLERFGQFLYVQFPTILEKGIDSLLGFGQSFAEAFPKIFSVGLSVLTSAVTMLQKIAGEIAANPLVSHFAPPTLVAGLNSFAGMKLSDMGLESPESEQLRQTAERRRKQAGWIQGQQNELNGVNVGQNDTGPQSFWQTLDAPAQTGTTAQQNAALEVTKQRLLKEAADAEAQTSAANPWQQKVQAGSSAAANWFGDARKTNRDFFSGQVGTEEDRAAAWQKSGLGNGLGLASPSAQSKLLIEMEIKQEADEKALLSYETGLRARLEGPIGSAVITRLVRAGQRS